MHLIVKNNKKKFPNSFNDKCFLINLLKIKDKTLNDVTVLYNICKSVISVIVIKAGC